MAVGLKLAPILQQIKVDIADYKKQMKTVAGEATKAVNETKKSFAGLQKASDTLKSVGSTLTKKVTLPIVAAGGACLGMAVQFEDSFAKVSTLLDSGTVNFNDYKKAILQGSTETGIAVGEYSDAVYQSISANVEQSKAIDFTTKAMDLAKGGFTSGTKAVDVLTTAINGYKLKTEDATKVSDILITTQNLGKTTVDELAESMGKVIPIASASGFKIEELSTAYALLTRNGIGTAEAGTYIKAMLNEVSKSGSQTDKVLRELTGKGFTQLKTEGKSTTEILGLLDGHAKKNKKSLKDMFSSVEAGSAAMVIANGEGKEYNEILGQIEGSAGATQGAVDKMDASPVVQFKKAFNELKNAGIELGQNLLPFFTAFIEKVSSLAKWFSSLDQDGQKAILCFAGIAAAIGPLLSLVGGGISTFITLKTAFAGITTAAGAAGVSLGAFLAPIALVVAGVIALAVAISTNFMGIRDSIVNVMSSVKDFISAVWEQIKFTWENNLMGIRSYLEMIFNNIKIIIETVFGVIKGIFDTFAALFRGDWEGFLNGIKNICDTIWTGIKNLIKNFLNGIVDVLLNIGVTLLNAAYTSFQKCKEGATKAWNALKEWFSKAIDDPVATIKGVGTKMFNAGKSMLNSVWDGCKSIWSSVVGWFNEKVSWLTDKLLFWKKGKSEMDGSHYNGTRYIPFDGYNAVLHKGEMVLTAKEAQAYKQGKGIGQGSGGINITIENFVNNTKEDVNDLMEKIAFEMQRRQLC